jgi:hypothetical protein
VLLGMCSTDRLAVIGPRVQLHQRKRALERAAVHAGHSTQILKGVHEGGLDLEHGDNL